MKYSEKHQVEFYECDENEHLKLPSMVDLMMQVSEHQLDKRGIGTNTLVKHGEGWVVTQYHFDIENSYRQHHEGGTDKADADGFLVAFVHTSRKGTK